MLDAQTVSEPAPGGVNFDYLLVATTWAVVLDGVSSYPVDDVGCRHGGAWQVAHLGGHLGTALALSEPGAPMKQLLGEAIQRTADDHPECDLRHPLTPASTVAMIRFRATDLDWLVLADSAVAWVTRSGEAHSVTDDRLEHLQGAPVVMSDVRRYDPAYVASVRNQPGGFWVAGADPAAAYEALIGSVPITTVAKVGLFTDGITRLVDRYAWSWRRIFAEAEKHGARTLVRAVRKAETSDPDPSRWRGKPSDDASAVIAQIRQTDTNGNRRPSGPALPSVPTKRSRTRQ